MDERMAFGLFFRPYDLSKNYKMNISQNRPLISRSKVTPARDQFVKPARRADTFGFKLPYGSCCGVVDDMESCPKG